MKRRIDQSAAIDRTVRRHVGAGAPGLALAVIRDGEVVHLAGYGLADAAKRTPVTPRTQFHLASCGKQFTGLGIMLLKQAGRLRYDDHIGRHIPELSGFPEAVTIRSLLHHLSGVHDLYEDDDGERKLLALSPHPVNEDVITLYAVLGWPTGNPGVFAYSNSGYDLLGCVIERVSGQSYRDFFAKRVFGPLGVHDTFSLPAKLTGARIATGYEKERGRLAAQSGSPLDGICGSGSFYATAADLCGYEAALASNRLVTAATMREALESGIDRRRKPTGYGFGWGLSDDFIEHSGGWTGFGSHIRRYRDGRFSIYALSNNPGIEPSEVVAEIARLPRLLS
jgi:CubicO group peptidase (beta-lactamase class C family)